MNNKMTKKQMRKAVKAEVLERIPFIVKDLTSYANDKRTLLAAEQLTAALLDILEEISTVGEVKRVRLDAEIVTQPLCIGGQDSESRLKELRVLPLDADLSQLSNA